MITTKQHQLLSSAASLFIERSMASFSKEQLQEKLSEGLSSALPWETPLDLLSLIFDHVWAGVVEKASTALGMHEDPRDALSDAFSQLFTTFLIDEPILGRCILLESHRYEPTKIKRCFAVRNVSAFLELIRRYVDDKIASGELVALNPDSLLELLLSIQDGMMFIWSVREEIGYSSQFTVKDFETVSRLLVSSLLVPSFDQSKTYYDTVATEYDALYTDAISQAEDSIIADMLRSRVVERDRILDLGCGTGLGYELITRADALSFTYEGIDISSGMVRAAQVKHLLARNANFRVMDMSDLAFYKAGSFDFVFSLFGSFSHVMANSSAVQEIRRVLAPKGRFLIMTYSQYSWRNIVRAVLSTSVTPLLPVRPYEIRKTSGKISADARFYTKESLTQLFSSFHDVRVRGLNRKLELPWIVRRYRHPAKFQDVRRLLLTEQERLARRPNGCHSLITEGVKDDASL